MTLPRWSIALLALPLVLLGGLGGTAASAEAAPQVASGVANGSVTTTYGRAFYVSTYGSDSADGRSSSHPWRTLGHASQAALQPGDRLFLRGGSTFNGPNGLSVGSSGTSLHRILISSYGVGRATITSAAQDCVAIGGSYVTVRSIAVAHCTWAGFHVRGDHTALEDVDAGWNWAGVQIENGASYTSLTGSAIHDNTKMTPDTNGPDDDSGAFGVLASGDHIRISGNEIRRQDAPSQDYGRDGSAVEVFGGRDVTIDHNRGAGNQTFTEVGGLNDEIRSMDLQVSDNLVTSKAERTFFVVVHAGDSFGSAHDVQVMGNTATLTGADSVGVVCGPQCTSDALTLGPNVINAAGGAQSVGGTYARR